MARMNPWNQYCLVISYSGAFATHDPQGLSRSVILLSLESCIATWLWPCLCLLTWMLLPVVLQEYWIFNPLSLSCHLFLDVTLAERLMPDLVSLHILSKSHLYWSCPSGCNPIFPYPLSMDQPAAS